MNIDAAVHAVRAESLERSAGHRTTRDRVLEGCGRSPSRRLHGVIAAVIASMFGASAFAWYARAPQPPMPRAAVIAHPDTTSTSELPAPAARTTVRVESVVVEAAPAAPRVKAPSRDAELALYATAHALHFKDRNLAAALAAWDRYLVATPKGRLVPEARFNRLVALVRLQRWIDATAALDTIDPTFRPGDLERIRRLIASNVK